MSANKSDGGFGTGDATSACDCDAAGAGDCDAGAAGGSVAEAADGCEAGTASVARGGSGGGPFACAFDTLVRLGFASPSTLGPSFLRFFQAVALQLAKELMAQTQRLPL